MSFFVMQFQKFCVNFLPCYQQSVQGQQLREATLCCPVPKHLRLLSYISMRDLDGRCDTINILIVLYLKSLFFKFHTHAYFGDSVQHQIKLELAQNLDFNSEKPKRSPATE